EEDDSRLTGREDSLYELVDGILVEKVTGFREECLSVEVGARLGNYAVEQDLGIVTGPDATVRLAPRLVRIPDVAFFPWELFPGKRLPRQPIPDLAPAPPLQIPTPSTPHTPIDRKFK